MNHFQYSRRRRHTSKTRSDSIVLDDFAIPATKNAAARHSNSVVTNDMTGTQNSFTSTSAAQTEKKRTRNSCIPLSASMSSLFLSMLKKRRIATSDSSSLSLPQLLYQRQICTTKSVSNMYGGNQDYATCSNRLLIQTTTRKTAVVADTSKDRYSRSSVHSSSSSRKRRKPKHDNTLSSLLSSSFLPSASLLTATSSSNRNFTNYSNNKQWKDSMKRILPFTSLYTPYSDAILGIDASGSYLLAVSDGKRQLDVCNHIHYIHNDDHDRCARRRGANYSNVLDAAFPLLSIRFYAVPSPAAIGQRKDNSSSNSNIVSPHVCTVPLVLESIDHFERSFESTALLSSTTALSVTNTRIQILLSRDGVLGVAFVHHSTGEDVSSSIVIFNTPKYQCMANKRMKILRCSRIRVGSEKCHTLRNLLWPTKIIPQYCYDDNVKNGQRFVCERYQVRSNGYVLFNDEDDGFRIFWIVSNTIECEEQHDIFNTLPCETSNGIRKFNIKPQRNDIIEKQSLETMETVEVDAISGYSCIIEKHVNGSSNEGNSSNSEYVNIEFEAYFHVDALLIDILNRRKNLIFGCYDDDQEDHHNHSVTIIPNYFYNIISFNSSTGRSLTLVLTFANPSKRNSSHHVVVDDDNKRKNKPLPAAYALFVEIDLFDQSYNELEWMIHRTKYDSKYLRDWSNTLATQKRMHEMKLGPYCVNNDLTNKLKGRNFAISCCDSSSSSTNEVNLNDFNNDDDDNVELWEPFVLQKLQQNIKNLKEPKSIEMSSLYTFCDVISNDAVLNKSPVKKLKCRDYPLEISYGST